MYVVMLQAQSSNRRRLLEVAFVNKSQSNRWFAHVPYLIKIRDLRCLHHGVVHIVILSKQETVSSVLALLVSKQQFRELTMATPTHHLKHESARIHPIDSPIILLYISQVWFPSGNPSLQFSQCIFNSLLPHGSQWNSLSSLL